MHTRTHNRVQYYLSELKRKKKSSRKSSPSPVKCGRFACSVRWLSFVFGSDVDLETFRAENAFDVCFSVRLVDCVYVCVGTCARLCGAAGCSPSSSCRCYMFCLSVHIVSHLHTIQRKSRSKSKSINLHVHNCKRRRKNEKFVLLDAANSV